MSFDLPAYLAPRRAAFEELLAARIDSFRRDAPARLVDAMAHGLLAGGKRLRPLLALAAHEAVGGTPAGRGVVLDFAVALEFLHTYSLIHDDLPAMDDDDLRRGRPTCHVVYGEATAILAGDALLTEAFGIVAGGAEPERLRLVALLARAGGAVGVVGGQELDLALEGRVGAPSSLPSLAELENVHRRKTGALIACAAEGGAVAAGALDRAPALRAYGEAIGLAFQIVDDVLDVVGDPARMGKSCRGDAAKAKPTYPVLVGLEGSRQRAAAACDRAIAAVASLGEAAEPLRALARYSIERMN
jgi:geranylgeranyl diphosphate synthase type II